MDRLTRLKYTMDSILGTQLLFHIYILPFQKKRQANCLLIFFISSTRFCMCTRYLFTKKKKKKKKKRWKILDGGTEFPFYIEISLFHFLVFGISSIFQSVLLRNVEQNGINRVMPPFDPSDTRRQSWFSSSARM